MSLSNSTTCPELLDILRAHTKLLAKDLVCVFAQLRPCPFGCTCTNSVFIEFLDCFCTSVESCHRNRWCLMVRCRDARHATGIHHNKRYWKEHV